MKYNIFKKISFYKFRQYIVENKKIEGIKIINNLFRKKYFRESLSKIQKLTNVKKKLQSIIIINRLLDNRITIIRLKALNSIDIFLWQKMKSDAIYTIIEIINQRRLQLIANAFYTIKNYTIIKIITGLEIINEIFIYKKNKQNYYVLNKLKDLNDFIITKNNIIYLESILFKIILYHKGKTLQKIKTYIEKKKKFQNIYYFYRKNDEYKTKSYVSNKLIKSTSNNSINKNNNNNNNYNNILNKSQDNIISKNTNITLSSKTCISKKNTASKWLNSNKIDNTGNNFKIESNNQRNIIAPSPKDFISFTLNTNNKEKKSEDKIDIDDNDNDNDNKENDDDDIWTINVEKWEANQDIDDSFYKSKNDK